MTFDVKKILSTLETGVQFAENLTPLLDFLPGGAVVSSILAKAPEVIGAVTDIAANVVQQLDDGKIVMESNDENQIRAMLTRLEAADDALAAYIDAH